MVVERAKVIVVRSMRKCIVTVSSNSSKKIEVFAIDGEWIFVVLTFSYEYPRIKIWENELIRTLHLYSPIS